MLISIDPGTEKSGICIITDPKRGPFQAAKLENYKVLRYLFGKRDHKLSIETMTATGMAVGESTFKTAIWIGRFLQQHNGSHRLVKRGEVKIHICGSMQAKDSNIRQALIDRFGGKGTKEAPGLLYGFTNDLYSALAIGLTALETPETSDVPFPKLKVVQP